MEDHSWVVTELVCLTLFRDVDRLLSNALWIVKQLREQSV